MYYKIENNIVITAPENTETVSGFPLYLSSLSIEDRQALGWYSIVVEDSGVTEPTIDIANDCIRIPFVEYIPAPVLKTGMLTFYFPADDGALQKGTQRPDPLYTVLDNPACVRDNASGIVWAKNANVVSNTIWDVNGMVKSWADGMLAISNLNVTAYGGRTDWRMPNCKEMDSLLNYESSSAPFISDATGTNQWTAARGPWTNVRIDTPGRYLTATSYRPVGSTYYLYRDLAGSGGHRYKNHFDSLPVAVRRT